MLLKEALWAQALWHLAESANFLDPLIQEVASGIFDQVGIAARAAACVTAAEHRFGTRRGKKRLCLFRFEQQIELPHIDAARYPEPSIASWAGSRSVA